MAKKCYKNLLSFNDFSGELPLNKQKKTKRTEVGLDVLNEQHNPTREGKLAYIIDNIADASNELIDSFYQMLEGEIDITPTDRVEDSDEKSKKNKPRRIGRNSLTKYYDDQGMFGR